MVHRGQHGHCAGQPVGKAASEVNAWARSFRVINQRRALVFNFFLNATAANGFFSPATLAAASAPLPFTNYNDPQQVHLALTKKQGCAPHSPAMPRCMIAQAFLH